MKRYSFCPVCGGPLDPDRGALRPTDVLVCGGCGFHFWQASKPAVAALVVRLIDGSPHTLLTRRGIEPYKGMWDLPGGFLGNGERPEEGLAREMREELGVPIFRPYFQTADIDEYPRDDIAEDARFVLTLYYRCEIAPDAVFEPSDDVVEAAWFPLDGFPAEVAFACNRRALAALRASYDARVPGAPDGIPGER